MSKKRKPASTGIPLEPFVEKEEGLSSPFDDDKVERERERKEEERRIRARIMQIRFFTMVFLFLVLSTLYVAGLNAYAVWNSGPKPYRLKAIHSMAGQSQSVYVVHIDWVLRDNESVEVVRPKLRFLNGEYIPSSVGEGLQFLVGAEQVEALLQIYLPPDVSPGLHEGDLVFQKRSGPESLPDKVSLPVHLEVSKWRDWWPLGVWLAVVVGAFVVFYLGSLLIFPKPQGFLKVKIFGTQLEYIIPLRKKRISSFFPWMRSSVNLDVLWSSLKGKSVVRAKGYLLFDLPNMPPTIVFTKKGRFKFFEKFASCVNDDSESLKYLVECKKSSRLIEGKMILSGIDKENIAIVFDYKKQKGFSQNSQGGPRYV